MSDERFYRIIEQCRQARSEPGENEDEDEMDEYEIRQEMKLKEWEDARADGLDV